MSMIHVQTKHLVGLLTDLIHTSAPDDLHSSGVLLHSARGYADATEPGQTDLLVGTSTNGFQCGHTWTAAAGQLPAMLWRLDDAHGVISTFKKKARGHPEHAVDIRRDADHITVAEDPQLFGETSMTFTALPLDDYPRDLWKAMDGQQRVELDTDEAPRTDLSATQLATLAKIARRHGAPIQLYRYHQRRYLLVQIGDCYRGVVAPHRWDADAPVSVGDAPGGDLYPPVLPDPDEAVAR